MIEINLLPHELRKKVSPFAGIAKMNLSSIDVKNIPVLHIVIGICGIVVALQIGLFAFGMISSAQLSAVSKRLSELMPQKKEADVLKARVTDINRRSAAIDELMLKRFSWAKKLSALSDCVTPGIWLSELSYDERQGVGKNNKIMPGSLIMSGFALGAGEQGTSLVRRFIKTLQGNQDFSVHFESIDLVSSRSDKVDGQDVMSFRITCHFK